MKDNMKHIEIDNFSKHRKADKTTYGKPHRVNRTDSARHIRTRIKNFVNNLVKEGFDYYEKM